MEIEIPITLTLDNDGFLRRECPQCMREFKWHHGPANEEAEQHHDPTTYYCPFCGQPAGQDSWWTQQQLVYVEAMQEAAGLWVMDEGLDDLFKGMSSKHFKVRRTGHLDIPEEPSPPLEPDDMTAVISPCHPYEPVKVPEDMAGPFYCLVCGSAFAV
jgi:hypothetical protein